MRDLCECLDVAHVARGIADRFCKHGLCALINELFDCVRLIALSETADNALTRQHVAKQRVGRAIKLGNGNDVPASIGEIDQGKMQRGLAGCHGKRTNAPLELGDTLFQHGCRGVCDSAVAKSLGFKVEQSGAMIGAVKRVCNCLIDWNGDRPCCWIWVVAAMDGYGFGSHVLPDIVQQWRNELSPRRFASYLSIKSKSRLSKQLKVRFSRS